MEDHRKHDNNIKKKNSKSMPVAIQIGGSFGIVLFGGALVVATVVSAATLIAFKTRRQHRHRSISKDTHTPDANPNDKELLLKSHQDLSDVDSRPLNLHSPSDGVTSNNKEMETKNIQTFTLDQDHNSVTDNDEQVESGHSNEESICSVVGEDEENISIYVDSVFESRQIEDSYEKLILGCEEQVVMAAPIELRFPSSDEDSCSEILENGEMLIINNENDEHINEAIEVDVDIVEYVKAIEDDHLLIGDDVVEASEDEEMVIKNATMKKWLSEDEEVVKVEDNPQVKFLEEEKQIDDCDDDMIPLNYCEETEINQQMQCNNKQVVMEEEEAACVHVVGMEEIHVSEGREITPSQLMNEEEVVQERVTIEEEFWNKKEKEILHAQVIEADKVDDNKTVTVEREDNPPTELMSKQEKVEMNVEYEIPVIQSIQEEDVNEVSSNELQDSSMHEELTREAKTSNQNDRSNHIYNGTSIKEDKGIKSEPWNLKLWSWSILGLIWCLCHWYSDLPYRELSLIASFFFIILILLRYRRTTYVVKYD